MILLSAYQFVNLDHLPLKQAECRVQAKRLGLIGTVLLASEGINFSLGGEKQALLDWMDYLAEQHQISQLTVNWQPVTTIPFLRLRIRIRPEIITFDPDVLPHQEGTASHVDPKTWHALIQDPKVQLVDTRNRNELEVGTFRNAQDPKIEKFSEFKDWSVEHLDPNRPVAMFCTGGVRCEKAGAYLKRHGFEEVYQLQGGILNYLKTIESSESLWDGDCFVFDDRVSVNHALEVTDKGICAGCRNPMDGLGEGNLPPWDESGRCGLCDQQFSPAKVSGIKERIRQMALAKARGDRHLGPKE